MVQVIVFFLFTKMSRGGLLVNAAINLSFINSGEFPDQLSDSQLHKESPATLR
jgi:hypothetical protein